MQKNIFIILEMLKFVILKIKSTQRITNSFIREIESMRNIELRHSRN